MTPPESLPSASSPRASFAAPSVRPSDDCCPVCGSDLKVEVFRLVMMFHCNRCGSEITQHAWKSSDRLDKRLSRRIRKMQNVIDQLNDIAVNGYPEEED